MTKIQEAIKCPIYKMSKVNSKSEIPEDQMLGKEDPNKITWTKSKNPNYRNTRLDKGHA